MVPALRISTCCPMLRAASRMSFTCISAVGELGQPIVLSVGPAIVEGDVLTLDEAGITETLPDHRDETRVDGRRTRAEQPDHRQGRPLLRARRERQGGCAGDGRDELSSLQ